MNRLILLFVMTFSSFASPTISLGQTDEPQYIDGLGNILRINSLKMAFAGPENKKFTGWKEKTDPAVATRRIAENLLAIVRDPDKSLDSKKVALLKLSDFYCKMPEASKDLKPYLEISDFTANTYAAWALASLGCDDAIDDVIEAYKRSIAQGRTGESPLLYAIAGFGPAAKKATPTLEKHLFAIGAEGNPLPTNKVHFVVPNILYTLIRINGDDPEEQYRLICKVLPYRIGSGQRGPTYGGVFGYSPLDALVHFPKHYPEIVPYLEGRAKEKNVDAIALLGKIGAPAASALPTLRSLLNQGFIGSYAEKAIASIKKAEAEKE